MSKAITYFITGMGIGQIFYLLILFLQGRPEQTFDNILSVSLLSGLMGLAGLVYSWEKLAPLYQRTVHLILIFGLVVSMMTINGWFERVDFLSFAIEFSVIYLLINLGIIWHERSLVQKINKKIKDNRSNP